MSDLIGRIPVKHQSEFLSELLYHYVEKQGLGAIPKGDLDALIIYLYCKYRKETFNAFDLSQQFLLKEARVKSLYETGLMKYGNLTEGEAWIGILTILKQSRFELDSLEQERIRFKFDDPALYKYLQKRIRSLGGVLTYSRSHDAATITLSLFLHVLDHIFEQSQVEFSTKEMAEIHVLIEQVIQQLGKSLGASRLRKLKGEQGKMSKVAKVITTASKLTSIGKFVLALLED